MKKLFLSIFVVIIAVTLVSVFSLTSCKVEEVVEEVAESEVAESEETATGGPYKIGHAMAGTFSLAFVAGNNYMKKYTESIGHEYLVINAENDIAKQTNDVEDLISQGCDALIICALDSKAIGGAIASAKDAGIPVITYNRPEHPDNLVKSDCFVGHDTGQQMVDAAEALAEIMHADGIKDEDVKAMNIIGYLQDENAVYRQEAAIEVAEKYGWEIVVEVPTDWNPDILLDNVTNSLEGHPEVNTAFLCSDFMWEAYASALDSQGRYIPRGEEGHIYTAAQDVFPVSIQPIRDKYCTVSVDLNVYKYSQKAVDFAVELIEGGTIEKYVNTWPAPSVTYENIDDPEIQEQLWAFEFLEQE